MWWEPVIQLASITIGVVVVVWQIGRQHRNSLYLQQQNQQDELKLSLYREMSVAISNAQEANLDSSGYVSALRLDLVAYLSMVAYVSSPKPISKRATVLANKHALTHRKVVELIVMLERFDVVSSGLGIFRLAFSSALHDLRSSHIPLHQKLLTFLPMDVPIDRQSENLPPVIWPSIPTLERYDAEIGPLVAACVEASMVLSNYIYMTSL